MFTKNNQTKRFLTLFLMLFYVSHNAYAEKKKHYDGSLDFGATFANGNSKEQSIQSNFDLQYHFNKKVDNIIKARAENKKTNKIRTKETYYINNQTRKNISQFNFKFLEIEFISDRFGGYNYRTSETLGIGRKLVDHDTLKLTIQSSIGLRQIKLVTEDKSNDFIFRFGSNVEKNINKHVSLEEGFDVSFDQNATIIRSDTNLKILISRSLYLKFGVLFQRVSNVPEGTKNSDVTTALKLGYEF